jgi:hypothetical protein
MTEVRTLPNAPDPFGWKVRELMFDRGAAEVEDLELSAESEAVLSALLRGERVDLAPDVVQEIADALQVDWRNHSKEAVALANAACWFLFVPKAGL